MRGPKLAENRNRHDEETASSFFGINGVPENQLGIAFLLSTLRNSCFSLITGGNAYTLGLKIVSIRVETGIDKCFYLSGSILGKT